MDLSKRPVADASDPSLGAGAAAQYIECDHGVWAGGWSLDFGPPGSAPDPDGALDAFLDDGFFPLPRGGFTPAGRDQDRRLYVYSVEGSPKASVVVADGRSVPLDAADGWVVETFASCDPAEFDESIEDHLPFEVWLDAAGNRVPTSTISSSSGPEHCGWDSVTFLAFGGRQYVRDPRGVLSAADLVAPFVENTELPSDAADTGYRREGLELWISRDRAVAYVVDKDRVEAWPSSTEIFGCA